MENMMEDNGNLKLVRHPSDVPEDYELVEIEDVTKLSEAEYDVFRSLVRKDIMDGTIKLIHKVEVDKEKDIGEECVNFTSTGDVGVHRQYQMGSYTKTSQRIKGCPVFELDHNEKDKRHYFLFVGPDGRWRIGPDVTSYSGSVLKHPQKNAKLPPRNGWLYYLDNKWKEAESVLVTLNVKYDKDKEEAVKFVSKGDARDHRKNRMGSYIKTSETMRGCPMFEQVDKQEGEKQHYLFVGRDGCWRVGPDVTSYSGSVLKHPKKNEEKPPKTGWLYYLDNKWNEDDSLQLIRKEDVPQAKANIQNKIFSSCDCTIVEHDYVDDGYVFHYKNITCLGMAILRGETAAVETSLKKGCDINYDKMLVLNSSQSVSSPLMLACQWPSLPIISLLVRHPGIEIDKRNKKGETALAIAATKPKNLEVVKILVESGAKVYLRDSKGYNPLQRAVEAGHLETSKYLHSKGANLYLHVTGKKLLWKAVDEENLPMVRYLVENGASLDSPHLNGARNFGCNPFQIAVFNLSVEIVKYMIEQGADVMMGTKYYYRNVSQTALEIAQYAYMEHMQECEREENKQKYEEVICMLKAAEAESKHDGAVNNCDCSIIEEFQVSEELEFRDLSCLGIAVLQNDIKAVETSLRKGCSINFDKIERNNSDSRGWTPLILASDLEMVKFLVEAGADPDVRNTRGHSLLLHAADDGQLEILKYLLSKGAYINTKSDEMGTPLWLAAHNGNLEMVKYLANQGANLNIGRIVYESFKDNRWYSPLNAAVEEGHVDVVKFLIKQGADVDEECESDGVRWSNLEIAWRKLDDPETEQRKKPLYEEIICILKEAGVKEPDGGLIKKSVLDTLDAIMWIWVEKIDFVEKPFPSWDWPNDSELPYCIKKLKVLTERNDAWLPMLQALMEVVSVQTPVGPIAMSLLIYHSLIYHTLPKPRHWEELKDIIPQMLKILEIGSSYDANDIRHGNICIILSSFVGHIQRNIYAIQIENILNTYRYEQEQFLMEMTELILTLSLDYLFGNLKPGSKPEIAIFSLLALEFLAKKKENGDNQNTDSVRKRFREYGPDDHPLLRIEKLVVSDDFAEKQAGFCAQWYLDNLWPIDNPDARNQKMIDDNNINVRLIPSDENKYLKLDSNGLEVRGDGPWFETAMSTVHVDEGSWYYEVTIVTGGFMQIGWATKQSEFLKERGYGVGDDKFSQSYDGCRQVVWYDRLQPNGDKPLGWAPEGQGPISSWKPGDVIGSLIDIENKEIVFSLNGVNIRLKPYKDVFEKVNDGFLAAISLMSFQQCQVNFGKDTFKHPPEEKIWKPLNECITKSS